MSESPMIAAVFASPARRNARRIGGEHEESLSGKSFDQVQSAQANFTSAGQEAAGLRLLYRRRVPTNEV